MVVMTWYHAFWLNQLLASRTIRQLGRIRLSSNAVHTRSMAYELERYELLCSHVIHGYNPAALSVSPTDGVAALKLANLHRSRESTPILIWAQELEKVLVSLIQCWHPVLSIPLTFVIADRLLS